MGPTYLVVLMAQVPWAYSNALVIYCGTDEVQARAEYETARRVHEGQQNIVSTPQSVYLTTVRAEAKLL